MIQRYETMRFEEGGASLDVKVSSEDKKAYLSLKDMCELFKRDKSSLSKHIKAIFSDEPGRRQTVAKFATVQAEGSKSVRREIDHFPIEVALAVGERIRSNIARKLQDAVRSYFAERDAEANENTHPIVVFRDGAMRMDVELSPEEDTAWLTQNQIAELYETTQQNVSLHISNIFREGEMDRSVHKESLYTASDGKTYSVSKYNLDMVLSVGYRVKSNRAIAFRKWASKVIEKYLEKGAAIDNEKMLMDNGSLKQLCSDVNYLMAKTTLMDGEFSELKKKIERESQNNNKQFENIQKLIDIGEIPPAATFYKGNFFSAKKFFRHLFKQATTEIKLVDPYADFNVLLLLEETKGRIPITLIKGSNAKLSQSDIDAYNNQYGNLTVKDSDDFHDRYALIDGECYHIGASYNRMGNKINSVTKYEKRIHYEGIVDAINKV